MAEGIELVSVIPDLDGLPLDRIDSVIKKWRKTYHDYDNLRFQEGILYGDVYTLFLAGDSRLPRG